jgi:hypothetical protein
MDNAKSKVQQDYQIQRTILSHQLGNMKVNHNHKKVVLLWVLNFKVVLRRAIKGLSLNWMTLLKCDVKRNSLQYKLITIQMFCIILIDIIKLIQLIRLKETHLLLIKDIIKDLSLIQMKSIRLLINQESNNLKTPMANNVRIFPKHLITKESQGIKPQSLVRKQL